MVAHQIAMYMYVWAHSLLTVTALLLLTHEEISWVAVELIVHSRVAGAPIFLLMLAVHTK